MPERLSSKQGTTTPSLKNVRKGVLKEIGVWQMLNNCLVCVDWCIIFFSLSDSCVSNCRRIYEWNVKFSPLKSSLPSLWFGAESHKLYATLVVYSISRLSPSDSSLKWKLQNYSQLDLFVFYGPFNFPITHQNISAKWTLYVARLCNRFLLFLFHFPICQVIRAKTFLFFLSN